MPDWKTHIVIGLLVALGWAAAFPALGIASSLEKTASLAFVAAFTSIFPDIDTRNSKMRGVFALAVAASVGGAYAYFSPATWYYALAYFALLYALAKHLPTKHRGITHTLPFAVLFSAAAVLVYVGFKQPFAFIDAAAWFGIALSAYSAHLLADSF
ncbi:MAG: metal-dependent hydrolase [Candidatus Aenigmarchaeota archaeon]|nr:metal-dependent hydrolase [Candidatus Aenigmarchaeota archaeon]